MCGVVLLALAGTAYMAVFFTRRARADLEASLKPLAETLNGEANVEDGEVSGQYKGQLAFGRVGMAENSMNVRVFQVVLIDAAGGAGWLYAIIRPRKPDASWEERIEPEGFDLLARYPLLQVSNQPPALLADVNWAQVEYSADAGHVRITKPMLTRKDIPDLEEFTALLAYADEIARVNRQNIENDRV
jgi:hypothetical protein